MIYSSEEHFFNSGLPLELDWMPIRIATQRMRPVSIVISSPGNVQIA